MNPITNTRNQMKMNDRELEMGLSGTKNSWHMEYKDSAWIFIGGMPYELSEGDMICMFSQYGEVAHVNLVRDHNTGKSRGFGFLCYEDQRSTNLAVDNLNAFKILNRMIRVDHVHTYKLPKDLEKLDEDKKKLFLEGCAPKEIDIVEKSSSEELLPIKQEIKKKKKKRKKSKKKRKKGKMDSESSFSESEMERRKKKKSRNRDEHNDSGSSESEVERRKKKKKKKRKNRDEDSDSSSSESEVERSKRKKKKIRRSDESRSDPELESRNMITDQIKPIRTNYDRISNTTTQESRRNTENSNSRKEAQAGRDSKRYGSNRSDRYNDKDDKYKNRDRKRERTDGRKNGDRNEDTQSERSNRSRDRYDYVKDKSR